VKLRHVIRYGQERVRATKIVRDDLILRFGAISPSRAFLELVSWDLALPYILRAIHVAIEMRPVNVTTLVFWEPMKLALFHTIDIARST